MFIRFNAIVFRRQGQEWVSVKDHKTDTVDVLTIQEYHEKSNWYSHNGGVIFGHPRLRYRFIKYDMMGIIPIALLYDNDQKREVKIPRYLYEENRDHYDRCEGS